MDLNLDKQTVQNFYKFMQAQYGLTYVPKQKSWVMKVCAFFVSLLGYMSKEKFMTRFTTTFFKKVYLSFKPGGDKISLAEQVWILVHECEHIEQQMADGFLFYTNYLFIKRYRLAYETEAYCAGIEMSYFLNSKKLNVIRLVDSLKNYGFKSNELNEAHNEFLNVYIRTGQKQYRQSATLVAMMFFETGFTIDGGAEHSNGDYK